MIDCSQNKLNRQAERINELQEALGHMIKAYDREKERNMVIKLIQKDESPFEKLSDKTGKASGNPDLIKKIRKTLKDEA